MDSKLWPDIECSKSKDKLRVGQPRNFAGAVRKQAVSLSKVKGTPEPATLFPDSGPGEIVRQVVDQVSPSKAGDSKDYSPEPASLLSVVTDDQEIDKDQAEFQEWKQNQKLKRQAKREEKRLQREEEFRKQLIAPKGYRVQLVSPAISTQAISSPAPASPLPGDFPALGTPVKSRSKTDSRLSPQLPHYDDSSHSRLHARRREPMLVDLDSIILKRVKKQTREDKKPPKTKKTEEILSGNPLDSSQPIRHRGKVRENPKPKKPTTLKRVVLKNRLTKKLLRGETIASIQPTENFEVCALRENSDSMDKFDKINICSLEKCRIESDQESELCDSVSKMSTEDSREDPKIDDKNSAVKFQQLTKTDIVHSLRFREYCDHILSPTLDAAVTSLLQQLVTLQNRAHEKDPERAKSKRRLLTGMHEAKKFLKIKKISLLIIAPDLEKCPLPGGVDSKIQELLELARAGAVPYLFCLGRRKFGRILFKKVPVSCVAVLNAEGAESELSAVTSLLPGLQAAYNNLLVAPSFTPPPTATPQERDVNEIVVTSLLTALEESLQTPKPSPFLQVIEKASQDLD